MEIYLAQKAKSLSKLAFVASQKPSAKKALKSLTKIYGNYDAGNADAIVALGGDGFMLETLRKYMPLIRRGLPVYGMNKGTIGFLMNEYKEEDLLERVSQSEATTVRPLKMNVTGAGGAYEELAFNEVSLYRQSQQAAHIKIAVDGKIRLEHLIADGVLIATPAGSTAYNLSAHGPVIPLGSHILALTPISAFRPRRWRGALLNADAKVEFEILDGQKRPVAASADNKEIRNIQKVLIEQDNSTSLTLLFDPAHGLGEKILRELFAP